MNIDTVIEDIKNGKPVIVVDNLDRENEGDIIIAAERCTVENLVFTMNFARGLMCVPASGEVMDALELPMMVQDSTDKWGTPFTVSVDAAEGITTGMSVYDRLKTISIMCGGEKSKPSDLARPGHLFPLRARDGLLKERKGHTEASIELVKLCGLKPVAVICEIMNNDGTMASGDSMVKFQKDHNLNMISVGEIYKAVYGTDAV